MVQFSGHFDGNVITPDERVSIPVNTPLRITIEVETPNTSQSVDWNRLREIAKECAIEGPEDLADRHDHCSTGDGEQLIERFRKYRGMLAGVSIPEIVELRHQGLP